MKTFNKNRNGKKITESWAVIDCNGEEFLSAAGILFEAAGDVTRAKRIAIRSAKEITDDDGSKFTIEKREV